MPDMPGVDPDQVRPDLERALRRPEALDRRSAAEVIEELHIAASAPALHPLLRDADPDVVAAAAGSLAALGDSSAVPAIAQALRDAVYPETRISLAVSLARLGSPAGIPVLLEGLDLADDLVREDAFESLFDVTGVHLGYDPFAPRPERLAAMARLQAWWARDGDPEALRPLPGPDAKTRETAWRHVTKLGGGEDGEAFDALLMLGEDAVPSLVTGLKYPPGFAERRARVCELLGRVGSTDAAPALAQALRDPVVAVAAWACWALDRAGDEASLGALRRYQDRILSLAAADRIPPGAGSVEVLLAQVARTRMLLGDEDGRADLVRLLLSDDAGARSSAIATLAEVYGERRGYDPEADLEQRREAAARWIQ